MIGKKLFVAFFLSFLLFFSACEGTPPINDLNVPMGLSLVEKDATSIKIQFYAYNPEPDFSGFCVYITTTPQTWESYQALSETGKATALPVIDPYIVSAVQGSRQYPTITYYAFPEVTTKTTLINYTIKWDGFGNALTPNAYYIVISALDLNNSLESLVSNMIQVNF